WMAPPVHEAVEVHEPPLPATVRPPDDPVVLRTIPFVPPLDEMLTKFRPLAPMVVLLTLRAVPVVLLIVLPVPVTFTVPPPVALKPAPDVAVMSRPLPPPAGVTFTVVPELFPLMLNAVLVPVFSVMVWPFSVTVPIPVLFAMLIPPPLV